MRGVQCTRCMHQLFPPHPLPSCTNSLPQAFPPHIERVEGSCYEGATCTSCTNSLPLLHIERGGKAWRRELVQQDGSGSGGVGGGSQCRASRSGRDKGKVRHYYPVGFPIPPLLAKDDSPLTGLGTLTRDLLHYIMTICSHSQGQKNHTGKPLAPIVYYDHSISASSCL